MSRSENNRSQAEARKMKTQRAPEELVLNSENDQLRGWETLVPFETQGLLRSLWMVAAKCWMIIMAQPWWAWFPTTQVRLRLENIDMQLGVSWGPKKLISTQRRKHGGSGPRTVPSSVVSERAWHPLASKVLVGASRTPASEWCLLRRPCLNGLFLLWVLQEFLKSNRRNCLQKAGPLGRESQLPMLFLVLGEVTSGHPPRSGPRPAPSPGCCWGCQLHLESCQPHLERCVGKVWKGHWISSSFESVPAFRSGANEICFELWLQHVLDVFRYDIRICSLSWSCCGPPWSNRRCSARLSFTVANAAIHDFRLSTCSAIACGVEWGFYHQHFGPKHLSHSFVRGLWALYNSLAAFCLLCLLGAFKLDSWQKILEHCRSKPEQFFGTCPQN